ncbi:Gx transporter family protein [candidate division WOR-3 bacterium]|nr:Gx transporter family protein [candidate division WOR-3 bacterium]
MTKSQSRFATTVILIIISGFLYGVETFIPRPVPFIRLGLGNVLVLFALINLGTKEGFQVGIGKSIVGALLTGSFLSPSLILSLAGTISSITIMWALYTTGFFGIIGLSMAGAITNGVVQAIVVSCLFAGTYAFAYVGRIMTMSGMITGCITGFITYGLLKFAERRSGGIEHK